MKNITYKRSKYTRVYSVNNNYYVYNSSTGFKAKVFDPKLIDQINRLECDELINENEIDERLINAKLCLKSHLDEELILQRMIDTGLTNNNDRLRLIILPTRECNFRCVYCYEEKRNEHMTQQTVNNLINAVKTHLNEHNTIKSLQLEWFGGEPLLQYSTIIKVSKELKSFCSLKNVHFEMSMTTNGYLLTKKKAEELLKYNLNFYQITIDGEEGSHDTLRPLKNGNPTFSTIYKNLLDIRDIKSDDLQIMIRINYHIGMLESIDDFLKQLKNDFDSKRFVVYMIKINPPDNSNLKFDFVTNKTEYIAQDYIFDLYKKVGLSTENYLVNLNPLVSMCYARSNSVLVIDVDGTIRKCTEYLEDNDRNNIGTIQNGKIEIDEEMHSQWLYPPQNQLKERGCYECKDFPLCYGGLCPIHWFREGSISCSIYHSFTDKMLLSFFENSDKENI